MRFGGGTKGETMGGGLRAAVRFDLCRAGLRRQALSVVHIVASLWPVGDQADSGVRRRDIEEDANTLNAEKG